MVTKMLFVLALVAVLFSGCGSETPGEDAAEAVDNAVAEGEAVEETIPIIEAPQVEVAVILESTNGAYTAVDPIDWSEILTQQVQFSEFTDNSVCTIFMANFETEENLRTVELQPGQAVLYFVLTQPAGSVPVAGVFDLTAMDVDFGGTVSIRVAGGSTVTLSQPATTVGELEILAVTPESVTGIFNVEERWTTASGAFQAEII
jgi:hypothetical protein